MENLMITFEETKMFMEDIDNVDFAMIKRKLQDKEEGQGWTKTQCNQTEKEYKKFLALKRAYPEKDIVPNHATDIFWHQHILDTEKYAQDCETIFGYFLHHYPYFGMRGKQDEQNLQNAFEETRELYARHFGGDYLGQSSKCKSTPRCRTQCKPMKCR
jgi:hypothetical protein